MAYFNGRPMEHIHCVSIDAGNAAMLTQEQQEGRWGQAHSLFYWVGRKLQPPREAWVILHCMGEQSFFHIYLYDAMFKILTDRQSRSTQDFRRGQTWHQKIPLRLQRLKSSPLRSIVEQRWSTFIHALPNRPYVGASAQALHNRCQTRGDQSADTQIQINHGSRMTSFNDMRLDQILLPNSLQKKAVTKFVNEGHMGMVLSQQQ